MEKAEEKGIEMKPSSCAVIIVTHNSQLHLDKCMDCLNKQSMPPKEIIIIDSGSLTCQYLEPYQTMPSVRLMLCQGNIGFCQGNNLGISLISNDIKYVLFLNPDAFLHSSFLEQAIQYIEDPEHQQVAALSGILLGYDIQQDRPTGLIDSTGIFRTPYGKWYDRGQGQTYVEDDYQEESVPALCGALMFCRKSALNQVMLGPYEVMDKHFYMYKEDIDLSIRLRQKGWTLKFIPSLMAYHCRGWQKDRQKVPRHLRLLSAKNEMRIYAKMRSPCLFYSTLKYLSVKLFDA